MCKQPTSTAGRGWKTTPISSLAYYNYGKDSASAGNLECYNMVPHGKIKSTITQDRMWVISNLSILNELVFLKSIPPQKYDFLYLFGSPNHI